MIVHLPARNESFGINEVYTKIQTKFRCLMSLVKGCSYLYMINFNQRANFAFLSRENVLLYWEFIDLRKKKEFVYRFFVLLVFHQVQSFELTFENRWTNEMDRSIKRNLTHTDVCYPFSQSFLHVSTAKQNPIPLLLSTVHTFIHVVRETNRTDQQLKVPAKNV